MSNNPTLEEIKNIYPEIPIGKAKNIQNQKFGKLTVIYRTCNIKKATCWVAQCECGKYIMVRASNLIEKKTKSCGCLKHEKISDLTGKRFGELLVLYPTEKRTSNRQVIWRTKCSCGNECEVRTDSLTSGRTKSCGCLQKKAAQKIGISSALNLSGQRFGLLVALAPTEDRVDGNVVWKCQCDCGNICYVPTKRLTSKNTQSCGCLKSSFPELIIGNILKENGIKYQTQKTFDNCYFPDTGMPARFDFYVNNEYLIEYDGQQHFSFTNYGWNTEENYLKTKKRDEYKNNWCKNNNIPLIRIPYYHTEIVLEDLLLETTNFLYTISTKGSENIG